MNKNNNILEIIILRFKDLLYVNQINKYYKTYNKSFDLFNNFLNIDNDIYNICNNTKLLFSELYNNYTQIKLLIKNRKNRKNINIKEYINKINNFYNNSIKIISNYSFFIQELNYLNIKTKKELLNDYITEEIKIKCTYIQELYKFNNVFNVIIDKINKLSIELNDYINDLNNMILNNSLI